MAFNVLGEGSFDDIFITEKELVNAYVGTALYATGSNLQGQLGIGNQIDRSSPVQVGALTTWKSADLRWTHSAAIKHDGTLWAWGTNNAGNLGNGSYLAISSPIQIGSLTNWSKVSTGNSHTAAIKTDGTMWSWGDNSWGQLGHGNRTLRSSPIQIGALTNWNQVTCGNGHTMAVKTDGTLWACGYNINGQLGIGDTVHKSSPVQVGALTDWASITASDKHTAAVKTDGTLWMWGYNQYGQLGIITNNTDVYRRMSSPVQVGSLTDWATVDSAQWFAAATKTDGTLWAWGYNGSGELGQGDRLERSSPVQIGALTNWAKISAKYRMIAAIKTDGILWAWGDNYAGRFGLGNAIDISSPVQVGALTNWHQVSCGYYHTAAVKTDGTLWSCGYNYYGQLGLADAYVSRSSPTQVGALSDWVAVSCGYQHTAAIKTDGTIWITGGNDFGQLGLGDSDWGTYRSSMTQIGNLNTWSKISAGHEYTAAVKTDGTLWTWGRNSFGQLGLGDFGNGTHRSSPVQVGSLTDWVSVTAGMFHTMATKTDGTTWIWGNNQHGQLGQGDQIWLSSPVQLGSLINWATYSCGYGFTSAIKTDGTLWTWGQNSNVQLGLGLITYLGAPLRVSSPVQIGALTDWASVNTGQWNTAAIKTDGTLWMWGYNFDGQLAQSNNILSYSSPVQVGVLTNWKQVSCGYNHATAIKTDGTAWAWGSNLTGQLGLGDLLSRSSPVQIGSLTTWRQITSARHATIATKINLLS